MDYTSALPCPPASRAVGRHLNRFESLDSLCSPAGGQSVPERLLMASAQSENMSGNVRRPSPGSGASMLVFGGAGKVFERTPQPAPSSRSQRMRCSWEKAINKRAYAACCDVVLVVFHHSSSLGLASDSRVTCLMLPALHSWLLGVLDSGFLSRTPPRKTHPAETTIPWAPRTRQRWAQTLLNCTVISSNLLNTAPSNEQLSDPLS